VLLGLARRIGDLPMKERPNARDIVGNNCAHPWNQGIGGSDIGERTEAFMGRRVDKQRPVALDAIDKEGQQGQLATQTRDVQAPAEPAHARLDGM